MKRNKILALVCALGLTLSLAGCGGEIRAGTRRGARKYLGDGFRRAGDCG